MSTPANTPMSAPTNAPAPTAAPRAHAGQATDALLLAALVAFCTLFVVWPIACFVWQGLAPPPTD